MGVLCTSRTGRSTNALETEEAGRQTAASVLDLASFLKASNAFEEENKWKVSSDSELAAPEKAGTLHWLLLRRRGPCTGCSLRRQALAVLWEGGDHALRWKQRGFHNSRHFFLKGCVSSPVSCSVCAA